MNRTWPERRHQRDRYIRRRINIVRNAWYTMPSDFEPGKIVGYHYGELSKRNLTCSCPMCRGPRYNRHGAQREVMREIAESMS